MDGFNLSKMSYAVGANPFFSQTDPVDQVTRFLVSPDKSTVANQFDGVTGTVTPLDANGNPVANYDGTAIVTSTDPLALPFTITFSNGVATIGDMAQPTIGNQTVTVTALTCGGANNGNTSLNVITGSAAITVTSYVPPAGPTASYGIVGPTTVTAGMPFTITATPYDSSGNLASACPAQAALTLYPSSAAALQAAAGQAVPGGTTVWSTNDYASWNPNNPTYRFAYNLAQNTAGVYVFTISQYVGGLGIPGHWVSGSSLITVNPGAPTHLAWGTLPKQVTPDVQGGIFHVSATIPTASLYLEDAYGNVLTTDSSDQISLSCSFLNVTSTMTVTFNQGVATFNNFALPMPLVLQVRLAELMFQQMTITASVNGTGDPLASYGIAGLSSSLLV